jgi:hypothetical protein
MRIHPPQQTGASDIKVTTVGIDLAKNLFQLHGVSEHGKVDFKKQLRRDQLAGFFVNLPACLIGMEACGSFHYWVRKLQGSGHTVKLMAPQFVKPYVKINKNDAADAEALCEAVTRPKMRFVPVKNVEQQAVLSLHCLRQGFVKARTARTNQIRGILGEFGLIAPQRIRYLCTMLIHGARAVIYWADRRPETCPWINGIVSHRNKNVVAAAIAKKDARIVWALLANDREYRPGYTTVKANT